MKHPYLIPIKNINKYSKVLQKENIPQYAENTFEILDINFDKLAFFKDVEKSTGIQVKEHKYLTALCSDPDKWFKPYDVYGFDNVIFYFKNEKF